MDFKSLQENGYETIIGDRRHFTPYMKNLIKKNRISKRKARSIRDKLINLNHTGKINEKQLILQFHEYLGDLDYNQLYKNVLMHNEKCPICCEDMDYGNCVCDNCGFDFKLAKFSEEDFKNMLKIRDFVESHESLKKEAKRIFSIELPTENLIHKIYANIYWDRDLRKEYEDLNLDKFCDLNKIIGFEDDRTIIDDNQFFKNMLLHNEICPECYHEMDYEKYLCKNCGFDIRQEYFTGKEFSEMRKICDFVDNHESLQKEVEKMGKDNIHYDNFTFDLAMDIAFNEELLKEYTQLNLNELYDLYQLAGFKESIDNLEYNELLKNVITHQEECPIFQNKMDYEKGICDNCGFDFKLTKFTAEDFRNMRKIHDFIENHESLTKKVEEMEKEYTHHNTFVKNLYAEIYCDEDLKNEYDNLKLNEICDLDKLFGKETNGKNPVPVKTGNRFTEIDFCKLADNKYRLVEREDDSLIIPIDLNKFKYFKTVEETNDDELSLYDLSFVPWFLRHQIRESSFNEGYLTHNATKENWHDFSKSLNNKQLKGFLRNHGIEPLHTRKEVVEQIYNSDLPLEEFESEETYLTKEAYEFLKENEWISFYEDNLFYFDFLDFYNYLENNDGSIEEISKKYLDEHIELAIESLDFDYIIRSYNSQSKVIHLMGNLKEALTYDMRILILNMNPICLDYVQYPSHIPLQPENIRNLKKLKSEFGEEAILKAFNENWNFMGFKSNIIPKEEVWKYLTTALNSGAENEGSRHIRETYFNKNYSL